MKYIFNYFLVIFLLLNVIIVNSAFQSTIFCEINQDYSGKNVIISPLSIFQVLGLTTNGAFDKTQSEMLSILQTISLDNLNSINLKLKDIIKNFVTVELANGVMSTFEPIKSFIKICDKYDAPIEKLISENQVNEWCAKKTHKKITKIIEKLDPRTVMLLLSAVFFKGEWGNPFNPIKTYNGTFYNFGKIEKTADIMTQSKRFNYYQDKEIQAIELPYKNDSMSAIIILPNKDVDINKYINLNVNDEYIYKILDEMVKRLIMVNLPKFEIEFNSALKEILKRMGMEKAFEYNNADFSGINGEGGLYIDEVIHKTYLKVDEIGSEASGASMVDIKTNSTLPQPQIKMNIIRPFILIIKSNELPKNNDFLFMAKIEEI